MKTLKSSLKKIALRLYKPDSFNGFFVEYKFIFEHVILCELRPFSRLIYQYIYCGDSSSLGCKEIKKTFYWNFSVITFFFFGLKKMHFKWKFFFSLFLYFWISLRWWFVRVRFLFKYFYFLRFFCEEGYT